LIKQISLKMISHDSNKNKKMRKNQAQTNLKIFNLFISNNHNLNAE